MANEPTNQFPSPSDEVGIVESKFNAAKYVRWHHEPQWFLNAAFIAGRQWIRWNRTLRTVQDLPEDPQRVRLTINRILPVFTIRKAKVLRNLPRLSVAPASTEDEDTAAAKAGSLLLQYVWDDQAMDTVVAKLMNAMMTYGTAFLKVFWDEEKESALTEVVGAFDIYPDIGANTWGDCRWMIHARPVSVDVIRAAYPGIGSYVQPENTDAQTSTYQQRLSRDNTGTKGAFFQENRAVLKEYWELPTDQYPEGRLIVTAGGRVLDSREFPYDNKELPFIPFTEIEHESRLWGDALVSHLLPLQKEYNKRRSHLVENANTMTRPIWLVPSGSIAEGAFTGRPNEKVYYNPLYGKPEQALSAPIPNYVIQSEQANLQDIFEISGIHEVSRGTAPAGVESGVALAQLIERDDTSMYPIMLMVEEGMKRWGKWNLILHDEFLRGRKMLKIVGENNELEVMEFKASDIKKNFDVRVIPARALPTSQAARQSFILQLWRDGAIVNERGQPDTTRLLEMLELGNFEKHFEEASAQKSVARSENIHMLKGELAVVEEYEDHPVHMAELDRFRKSPRFKKQPEHIKQIFKQHYEDHKAAMVQTVKDVQALAGGMVGPSAGAMPPQTPPDSGFSGENAASVAPDLTGEGDSLNLGQEAV